MRTLETDPRLPAWLNAVLNSWPFCLDEDSIMQIEAFAWDNQGPYLCPDDSLFMNGYFMCKLLGVNVGAGVYLPIGYGFLIGWRWHGQHYRHCYWAGWKGNGRIARTFRIQTPAESAAGVLGPNSGQASGFDRGTA